MVQKKYLNILKLFLKSIFNGKFNCKLIKINCSKGLTIFLPTRNCKISFMCLI